MIITILNNHCKLSIRRGNSRNTSWKSNHWKNDQHYEPYEEVAKTPHPYWICPIATNFIKDFQD